MSGNINNKIIVILGSTASGKTKLAVALAYRFNGEIVSADSRQVYKGMDVGTGKDLREYILKLSNVECRMSNKKNKSKICNRKSKIIKIPYHLIDMVSPKTGFSLAKYQKLAYRAIDDILRRGKLPVLVGGTGLYLQAVVDGYQLSKTKPDKKLRKKLEKMSVEKLFKMLSGLDYKKAGSLNESDKKNKRRLIRYIEISTDLRGLRRRLTRKDNSGPTAFRAVGPLKRNYDFLVIGVKKDIGEIRRRIYKRLIERLEKEDMVGEVQKLRKQGLSWKRLQGFGLEYKFISLYLRRKLSYNEMVEKLNIAIGQFAKRQMSWFRRWERRGAKIHWIRNRQEVIKLINEYF